MCRGNGYIKATGLNEQGKSVIRTINQCPMCKSQGELNEEDLDKTVKQLREDGWI